MERSGHRNCYGRSYGPMQRFFVIVPDAGVEFDKQHSCDNTIFEQQIHSIYVSLNRLCEDVFQQTVDSLGLVILVQLLEDSAKQPVDSF